MLEPGNILLVVITAGLYVFYLAVAARYESHPLDRLISAWILLLGHVVVVPLALSAFDLAVFPAILAVSIALPLLLGFIFKVNPGSVIAAWRETLCALGGAIRIHSRWFLLGLPLVVAAMGLVILSTSARVPREISSRMPVLLWGLGFAIIVPLFAARLYICRRVHQTGVHTWRDATRLPYRLWWWGRKGVKAAMSVPLWLGLMVLAYKAVAGVFIVPYTDDGLSFHLPMALNLLDHGYFAGYTANGTLGYGWHASIEGTSKNIGFLYFWVLCLARNDALIFLYACVFPVVVTLSIYRLCRQLGATARVAAFAAPLSTFSTLGMVGMNNDMPDVIIAGLLTLALCRVMQPFGGFQVTMLGLTVGLLCGTHRFPTLPAGVLLLMIMAGRGLTESLHPGPGRARNLETVVRALGCMVLMFLVVGCYQYGLNLAAHQNPFYPFAFRLGPWSFPGVFESGAVDAKGLTQYGGHTSWPGRFWYAILAVGDNYRHGVRAGGWGRLFPYLMLPAILFSVWTCRRRSRYLGLLFLTWICFLLTPYWYWLRYTLFVYALSAVPVAMAAASSRLWRPIFVVAGALLATLEVVQMAPRVGPRGIMFGAWREYLSLETRWDRTCYISPHAASETGRAIHREPLGRDVLYADTSHIYYYKSERFDNRVVPVAFQTEAELQHRLVGEPWDRPVVVVRLGSSRDGWLAEGESFVCVYSNRAQRVYRLRESTEVGIPHLGHDRE